MKQLFILVLGLILSLTSITQPSIRINEFSQGINGAKEWVELLVTSTVPVGFNSCSVIKLDISNWILDDNNGDFSPTNHFTGSGVAIGHLRFKSQSPWNNLPVGALIVIYNAADKDIVTNFPSDDPLDANGDCVYVVPSNHSSLEYCTTLPIATSCTVRTDYSSCTYTTSGTWTNIGLANAGDAIQVRDPSYNLIHGLVYGRATSATGCTTTDPMVGNALAPVISPIAMSGTSAAFNGTTSADFYDATKWIIQSASLATPGWVNNVNDSLYIKNEVRGGCTCSQVLPLRDNIIIRPINPVNNSIKIVGGVIITKNNRHKKQISIYDVSGKLVNKLLTSSINIDLNPYLKNGLNLIRIDIDSGPSTVHYFKVYY